MFEIAVYSRNRHLQAIAGDEPFVLGPADSPSHQAIAIDSLEARSIHVTLEVARGGSVTLTNRGPSVVLPGGKRIVAGMNRTLDLPSEFRVGNSVIYLRSLDTVLPHDGAITQLPRMCDDPFEFSAAMKKLGGAPSSHTLAYWFEALGRLQRATPGTVDFFRAAAQAVFDPGGLDAAMILLREGDDWKIAGSYAVDADPQIMFRRSLLARLVEEKRTLFHDAKAISESGFDDCRGFTVVSPMLSEAGEIIGAVYAVRFHHADNHRRGIRPLEAQFVQAVADTVAGGLTRLAKETAAVSMRACMERSFSPRVARELERNPKLLEGTYRETSILFCDLRGFSSIAEQLSPRETYLLLGDVMDRFTHHITRFDGVVIDYFGDGLAAFWNAPLDQEEHAALACRAALAMNDELPDISSDWFSVTGRHLRFGVGIHTGPTLVGNAGSRSRIKYGPRGHAVNLASRVENATKAIGVPILITATTAALLGDTIAARRVYRSHVPGMERAVDLFQPLTAAQLAEYAEYSGLFQEALERYESHHYEAARTILESLREEGIADSALEHLLRRVREAASNHVRGVHSVSDQTER